MKTKKVYKWWEICNICNKRYKTIWYAPNWFWDNIMGYSSKEEYVKYPFVCITCFDKLCRKYKVETCWTCEPTWLLRTKKKVIETIKEEK